MDSKRFLIIDFCNFIDYPIGGYLSFAKNLMICFGNEIALAGITTDKDDPVGKWFKKTIDGVRYDFFAFAYYSKLTTKHLIPDRLASFLYIRKHRRAMLDLNMNNVFIQRQEILLGINDFGFLNICYCFAGLENPLSISKYWYAQFLARKFELFFFKTLRIAKVILASGDEAAIQEMLSRSNGLIERNAIKQFPTRINTDIFKPVDKNEARLKLNISQATSIIVTTGRLTWLKGWKIMIDCFKKYEKVKPGSHFYLIGEGEDLSKIEEYILKNELSGKVLPAGKQDAFRVALFLNAADLFIMGSYKEGWSTSLIEAIACGIPACVTNFSSAESIIIEGKNGYVIDKHDEDLFTEGMLKAVKIESPVYNENIKAYAVNKLKEELLKNWQLI